MKPPAHEMKPVTGRFASSSAVDGGGYSANFGVGDSRETSVLQSAAGYDLNGIGAEAISSSPHGVPGTDAGVPLYSPEGEGQRMWDGRARGFTFKQRFSGV